jgi:hypothetical protein
MGVLRDEILDHLRVFDYGDEVVKAEDEWLAVSEAAQQGVVGKGRDGLAALDAGRPHRGGRRKGRVAHVSTTQPLRGFVPFENGVRKVDCDEIPERRCENVRKVLRSAHDIQGSSYSLGHIAGEIQVTAGAHLVGVVEVQSCDSRGVSSRVLQTEGGQRQCVLSRRIVPPARLLVSADHWGTRLEYLAQYCLEVLGVLGAQHVAQPSTGLYWTAVESARRGVRLNGGEVCVVYSNRDPVLCGQCTQEGCALLVVGDVVCRGRQDEDLRGALHRGGSEGDIDGVAALVPQPYPAGRRHFSPTLTSRPNGSWGVIFWPMA